MNKGRVKADNLWREWLVQLYLPLEFPHYNVLKQGMMHYLKCVFFLPKQIHSRKQMTISINISFGTENRKMHQMTKGQGGNSL